jgi:hypothetical protein
LLLPHGATQWYSRCGAQRLSMEMRKLEISGLQQRYQSERERVSLDLRS